jgi:hypothetical protein
MNEITARNTSLFVNIIFANDNYAHTTPTLSNKPLPSENGGEEREKSTIVRLSITMETRLHEKGNSATYGRCACSRFNLQFSPSLLHHFHSEGVHFKALALANGMACVSSSCNSVIN